MTAKNTLPNIIAANATPSRKQAIEQTDIKAAKLNALKVNK